MVSGKVWKIWERMYATQRGCRTAGGIITNTFEGYYE
jgi:hypothetical protein